MRGRTRGAQRAGLIGTGLLFLVSCTAPSISAGVLSQPPSPMPSDLAVAGPQAITGPSPFRNCERSSSIATGAEVEPSLTVDPLDPQHLVATWQQDRSFRGGARAILVGNSADGGSSWQASVPPHLTKCSGGPYQLASDPVVSAGPGRAYLASIAINTNHPGNAVVVSSSNDGGTTWGDPVVVASGGPGLFLDKEWVLADRSVGTTAYVVWVQYRVMNSGRPPRTDTAAFSRTIDGGKTWSPPSPIYGANTETQFHELQQLSDGSLLDAFIEARTLESARHPTPARIAAMRSTDRGKTWTRPVTAARFTYVGLADPIEGKAIRATSGNLSLAVGADGSAFVCWTEEHLPGSSRVLAARSPDGGATWGPPVTVASVESRVFLPTVAVASNGVIGVTWYDFRNLIGKTRLTTDAWLAWSNDEGAAWRTLHLAGPFDLHTAHLSSDGLFLGDYEALAGLPDGFAAVYALAGPLSRSGPTDIFFSRIALPPGAP